MLTVKQLFASLFLFESDELNPLKFSAVFLADSFPLAGYPKNKI